MRTIVSAWATEHGLALGQSAVADKSNEITAVPELLRALELARCTFGFAQGHPRRAALL